MGPLARLVPTSIIFAITEEFTPTSGKSRNGGNDTGPVRRGDAGTNPMGSVGEHGLGLGTSRGPAGSGGPSATPGAASGMVASTVDGGGDEEGKGVPGDLVGRFGRASDGKGVGPPRLTPW